MKAVASASFLFSHLLVITTSPLLPLLKTSSVTLLVCIFATCNIAQIQLSLFTGKT